MRGIVFYFHGRYAYESQSFVWPSISLTESGIILVFALFVAMFHWSGATKNIVVTYLKILRAKHLLPNNSYHVQFQNILDELRVATGGHLFDGYVISSMAINAFSISNVENTKVIGVTEGLLRKLTRPQIEAIVAHEAAHILKGDSLITALTTSLFSLPSEIMDDFRWSFDDDHYVAAFPFAGHPGFLFIAVMYVKTFLTKTIGKVLNMFISRQRDYRADAIAVRLSRDPLALAEGLYLASRHWRGAGISGEKIEPIFFLRPRAKKFDEIEGFFSDCFATRPPVDKRLNVLLDIAHSDMDQLVESISSKQKQGIQMMYSKTEETDRWLVRKDGQWLGPLNTEEFATLAWIRPETLVKRLGSVAMATVAASAELSKVTEESIGRSSEEIYCPKCYKTFEATPYEGKTIYKCGSCEGVLATKKDFDHILITKEKKFSEDIIQQANIIKGEIIKHKDVVGQELYAEIEYTCPNCQDFKYKMTKKFFSEKFHVQIDECAQCGMIWFDKDELEILQYLAENDDIDETRH